MQPNHPAAKMRSQTPRFLLAFQCLFKHREETFKPWKEVLKHEGDRERKRQREGREGAAAN